MTAIITITTISNNITSLILYSNVDGFVSAFETNVPRSSLISGYSTNLIPIGTTIVRASSAEGPCTNYIDIDLTICQFSGSIECVAPTTTTTTTVAPTTTTTTTTTIENCVTNFGAGMVPCFGGTVDDYMEAEVTLQNNVSVDTTFTMRVYYIPGTPLGNCNNTQSTIDIDVTVPAGQNTYLVTCGEAPFIDEGGATICSFELIDPPFPLCTPTTTTTTTAVVNCIQYQIGTSSSFGISYSYIDCEGIEAGGTLGGAGGFDSDTFCAQEGSVDSGGMTLVDQGPCETPITTTTTTTAYIPVTGLSWVTTVSNPCSSDPWTISDNNTIIRYDVEDSLNCGGTCDSVQAGTATATITVDNVDTYLYLDFEGIGELEKTSFEKITFKLDGVQIAKANAAGGNLECEMGPVVKEYNVAPPYFLPANSTHTFEIDFTTNDNLFHVGSYYEVDLSFSNSGTTTTTTTAAPTTTTTTTVTPTTTTTTTVAPTTTTPTTIAPIGVNTVYVKYEIIT